MAQGAAGREGHEELGLGPEWELHAAHPEGTSDNTSSNTSSSSKASNFE